MSIKNKLLMNGLLILVQTERRQKDGRQYIFLIFLNFFNNENYKMR